MNFNDIVNNVIQLNNLSEKISNKILIQFKNIGLDGDKYKWCSILSKDDGKSKNKFYYKEILKLCEEYKNDLLVDSLNPEKLKIGSQVSRREISTMANCGNELWGILTDDINKRVFVAINETEPYEYPTSDGEYVKRYNEVSSYNGVINIKCFIQAIKGEKNSIDNPKNRKVIQCSGNDNDYKLYVFIKKNKKEKLFTYLGQFITSDVSKEKIDQKNDAYYFCFTNKITKDEIEKCSYNTFTKLNEYSDKEIKKLEKDNVISEEEKWAMVKVRINQSSYRNKLLKIYDKCPLTGITDEKLLIASHIKPYSKSSDQEKYDSDNGIILSPLIDKLFDKFLITFDDETGKIKYSNQISDNDLSKIKSHIICDHIDVSRGKIKSYLKYHNEIFDEKNYSSNI